MAEAPQLDVLHVPGGFGQEALMDDVEVLGWIRRQAAGATCVFSVCTGALILGAAGLLVGRRATTHWSAIDLLHYFGAVPVNDRVVTDGHVVFAAGVTAGIDGALRVAADLRGDEAAQIIQLGMAYAPEPPFNSGTPETAPPAVLDQARCSFEGLPGVSKLPAESPAISIHRTFPPIHRLSCRPWRRSTLPGHIPTAAKTTPDSLERSHLPAMEPATVSH